jgi:hypothetical protein
MRSVETEESTAQVIHMRMSAAVVHSCYDNTGWQELPVDTGQTYLTGCHTAAKSDEA